MAYHFEFEFELSVRIEIGHGKELYIESSKTGLFSFLFLLGLVAGVLSVNSTD
jgi:hypothetical protein